MAKKRIIPAAFLAGSLLIATPMEAEMPQQIDYSVSLNMNASTSKSFAPYMIGSWNSGRNIASRAAYLDLSAWKTMRLDHRFSWGAGVEVTGGYGSPTTYDSWDSGTSLWTRHSVNQAAARIIQLYGEIKYRGVFLNVGMKEQPSLIVDEAYSAGDLVRSTNACPIPGATVGFVDFQDIPFTNGWVQIEGQIMYGKMADSRYTRERYNYYNYIIAQGIYYTYKRCYFRTNPRQPLSVTVGMQAAGMFGGNTSTYKDGKFVGRDNRGFHFRDIWDMFFPSDGSGEGFYKGNSLGSWDFNARYNFCNGNRLEAYFEWPWEDGSGIGRRNGWDGLWGLEYEFANRGPVNKIVVEYLDFTNQSGPMHFAPGDNPGTTITTEATGGDNYYNNDFYGPYSNFGMAIGTPFLKSPVYNTDGFWHFAHNRARGFHFGIGGNILPELTYKALVSYQKAWGTGRIPQAKALHDTSARIGAVWTPTIRALRGWSLDADFAFDSGSLRGDNFGFALAVRYSGSLTFKKTNK